MSNTKNKYVSTEALRFVVNSVGETSSDAYEAHCEVISKIIDLARKNGIKIDESYFDDSGTKIYRIEKDGRETEVSGWLDDGVDEPTPEEKS